jgi:dihydrofolate reductase
MRHLQPPANPCNALFITRNEQVSGSSPLVAAQAFRAGLVDELRLFVAPVVVGGGKRALPDGARLELELLGERRFGGGMVYLRYRAETRGDGPSAGPDGPRV